jgi:hypothetical protein
MSLTLDEVKRAEMIMAARAASNKRYREKHREQINAKSREQYKAHRDERREQQAARNKANAELLLKCKTVLLSSNGATGNECDTSE